MIRTQHMKCVFNIDIKTCRECGGVVTVIACIEESALFKKKLVHLQEKITIVVSVLAGVSAPAQTADSLTNLTS